MRWDRPEDLATLLREESAGLRALAASLVRCDADADDCVQDACVAAMRAPAPTSPVAWLRAVVRNAAFRRSRDATRRLRREAAAAKQEGVPSARDLAERMEVRRHVLAAVERLEEPYRTTVTLRYLEGLSPAQIAVAHGVPVKTVKSRLHRALARLRDALDASYGGRRSAWLPLVASAAVPALGASIAMKKAALLVVVLLALGGGAWWVAHERGAGVPAPSEPTDATVGAQPVLVGAKPPRPEPAGSQATETPDVTGAVGENSFAGQVVDDQGRAVAGAQVRLVWQGVKDGMKEIPNGNHLLLRRERERHEGPSATTDAHGRFRIDRPYGSRSWLRAEAEGWPAVLSGPHPSGSSVVIRLVRDAWLAVRVLTEEGRPLADAEVRLVTPFTSAAIPMQTRQVLETQRTDAQGHARLSALSVGHARLEVAPKEAEWAFVDRGIEVADRDVEVRVGPARAEERRVVDAETGAPVADAWVDVLRSFEFGSPDQEGWRRRFQANSEGKVRFAWQEGLYSAYASAPGYEVVSAWEDPIRLTRAARVEGRVTDAAGRPVVHAALFLLIPDASPYQEAFVGRSPVAAWTDAAGAYVLHVVLPHAAHGDAPPDRGVRTIAALHPDHPAALVDAVPVLPGSVRRVDLRFPRPASLSIEVVDREGKPIAGQWLGVSRLLPRPDTWKVPNLEWGVDTLGMARGANQFPTTDSEGRAQVSGLPPGSHLVRAESTRAEVVLVEGETVTVRLVKGAGPGIYGRVLDGKGDPAPKVRVSLSGPSPAAKQTDTNGSFAFEDLPPGNYQVGASDPTSPGLLHASARARPGDEVTLRLPAGPARLRIAVEGPPAGTAEYSLLTDTGGAVPPRTGFAAMEHATVETDEFNPGTGVLVVQAKGYGWTAVRFDAPALRTTAVTAVLVPSGTIEVHVPAAVRALASEPKRALLRAVRLDDVVSRAIREEASPSGAAGVHSLRHAVSRSRGDIDAHAPVVTEGAIALRDLAPGPYEVAFGRYEKDRGWISHASVRVEVTSGATVVAELAR